MEVMAVPNQETLTFYKQVRPWIVAGEMHSGVMHYQFSDKTPKTVLDLFERIKDNLSYSSTIS